MLSLCSDGSLSQEMSVFSMWMDITPILSEVTRLRERATTMQSRRATLWREALNNPRTDVELAWIEMVESGLRSSWLRLERSFLRHARVWLRGHFFAPLPLLVAMPTGSTAQFPNRTDLLRDYNLSRTDFLSSLSSWRECMAGIEEVSASLRSKYTFLAWTVWAGALPVARGDVGAPFGFPRHRTSPPCQVWINADLLQNEYEASSSGEELDWVKPYGPGR